MARAVGVDVPRATAMGEDNGSVANISSGVTALSEPHPLPPVTIASLTAPDPVRKEAKGLAGDVEVDEIGSGGAALPNPHPIPWPVTPTEPVQNAATEVEIVERLYSSFEALDACAEPDVCVDQYLWSRYEHTPKVDTARVSEQIKGTVKKKKGKTRTVNKTVTKYVTQDFAWKDPTAAQKVGMSLKDYVIGGMD